MKIKFSKSMLSVALAMIITGSMSAAAAAQRPASNSSQVASQHMSQSRQEKPQTLQKNKTELDKRSFDRKLFTLPIINKPVLGPKVTLSPVVKYNSYGKINIKKAEKDYKDLNSIDTSLPQNAGKVSNRITELKNSVDTSIGVLDKILESKKKQLENKNNNLKAITTKYGDAIETRNDTKGIGDKIFRTYKPIKLGIKKTALEKSVKKTEADIKKIETKLSKAKVIKENYVNKQASIFGTGGQTFKEIPLTVIKPKAKYTNASDAADALASIKSVKDTRLQGELLTAVSTKIEAMVKSNQKTPYTTATLKKDIDAIDALMKDVDSNPSLVEPLKQLVDNVKAREKVSMNIKNGVSKDALTKIEKHETTLKPLVAETSV